MKESEAKFTVYILLIVGTLVSAYLPPPEIRIYTIFGYIGIFALVAFMKDGILFGKRVYPWGIKYNRRTTKRSGLFKKKPTKKGEQHHKRKK